MDGVVVIMLMCEGKVKEFGFEIMGYICFYVFVVIGVEKDMLMGFFYVILIVLDCVGIILNDFILIDMYEVFVV